MVESLQRRVSNSNTSSARFCFQFPPRIRAVRARFPGRRLYWNSRGRAHYPFVAVGGSRMAPQTAKMFSRGKLSQAVLGLFREVLFSARVLFFFVGVLIFRGGSIFSFSWKNSTSQKWHLTKMAPQENGTSRKIAPLEKGTLRENDTCRKIALCNSGTLPKNTGGWMGVSVDGMCGIGGIVRNGSKTS